MIVYIENQKECTEKLLVIIRVQQCGCKINIYNQLHFYIAT